MLRVLKYRLYKCGGGLMFPSALEDSRQGAELAARCDTLVILGALLL